MNPQIVHLPDGQTYTVTKVFGGFGFRSNDLTHHAHFPIGWTTVLHTEEEMVTFPDEPASDKPQIKRRNRPYMQPTLQNDTLFISSISSPSNSEFKPPVSPTRQIAMILWVSLYWYFHQQKPQPQLETDASKLTPDQAKPTGDWRITIRRDGVLRSRNLIPKLERMGLLATEHTEVGVELDDSDDTWARLFVSQRIFWQIPANLFLFTLQPIKALSPYPGSPSTSRPGSPNLEAHRHTPHLSQSRIHSDLPGAPMPTALAAPPTYPVGPFFSTSHLPTYYPPPPLQYTFTGNVRHPLRPKPPRMGEVFYTRFVPSMDQYLSFRVASLSPEPVPYLGPSGHKEPANSELLNLTDTELLKKWFAVPRVSEFWGTYTDDFLSNGLKSKHCFPAIGLWDGVPFGYFEIYWVKEDILGQRLGSDVNDWDRGLHVLVGEEWSRGRVPAWLTSLAHWCFTEDSRTMNVCLEPRIDNERYVPHHYSFDSSSNKSRILRHLDAAGFGKHRQVSFPHKQSWFVRLGRETWTSPSL